MNYLITYKESLRQHNFLQGEMIYFCLDKTLLVCPRPCYMNVKYLELSRTATVLKRSLTNLAFFLNFASIQPPSIYLPLAIAAWLWDTYPHWLANPVGVWDF